VSAAPSGGAACAPAVVGGTVSGGALPSVVPLLVVDPTMALSPPLACASLLLNSFSSRSCACASRMPVPQSW